MHLKRTALAVLLLLLLLSATACVGTPNGGGSALPEGFSALGTTEEGDLEILRFSGPEPEQAAVDGFATQLETEQWTRLDRSNEYEIGGYTGGIGFKRQDEFLLLQSTLDADLVRITLVIGPSELMTETKGPSPTGDPDGRPTEDIDGRDLENAPRFPGSVRIKHVVAAGFEQIIYLADATLDDVIGFHAASLSENGWGLIQQVRHEKTVFVEGTLDSVTLLIEASESRDYPGYLEIRFSRYFAPA